MGRPSIVKKQMKENVMALEVWLFFEYFQLPLGRFAPFIFGLMMGKSGKRIR